MTDTGPGYRIRGAKELRRTLRQAGESLDDLKSTHKEVAGIVKTAAEPRTPRRSGRLAARTRASAGVASAKVTNPLIYAGPIHWGWPRRNIAPSLWLYQAARDSEPTWVDVYRRRIDDILGKVKGI